MEVFTKTTVVFALSPIIISGVIIAETALAQAIIPTDNNTLVDASDNGVIDISGGTQVESNLFHSFERFNPSEQQTANFLTAPNTDAVIGQIVSGQISTIDGLLQITGSDADLYLINPAGLLFGPNARLNLGGSFTATTATHIGTNNQWFEVLNQPDYTNLVTPPSHFGFSRLSTISNQGQLSVENGQSLRLLAPQVINTGTLNAPDGEITLFAADPGQTIQLGQANGVLNLEIIPDTSGLSLPALVTGGDLEHSNELVIGNTGEAVLVNRDAANNVQPTYSLINAGDISTAGVTGGEINLLGNTIQVTDSTLNASGSDRGGLIRIGGDYQGQGLLPRAFQTHIAPTANLITDAIDGNGGQVIVWSDGLTTFDGSISARSVTGNGGLIETSGLHELVIGNHAAVTTKAPQGSAGLWLIDPAKLRVVETGGLGNIVVGSNDPLSNEINASTIVSALNDTNVTLQASDSITIDATVDTRGNDAAGSLFLDTNTLNLNERISLKDQGQLSGSATTVNVGEEGSIQNAVDAVANGGAVNLAATTYREGNTITLDRPLTLLGQGQNNTYISGDTDNSGTGNHRVFEITNSGDNINLTGLTIQNGRSTSDGAGLRNYGDNVALNYVTFSNNEVTGSSRDGGAIQNRGSLTLSNTIFDNNRTSSDGGAIDILQGSVTVADSIFINNQAGAHAGAIDIDPNGALYISNTSLSSNTAGTQGGAIVNEGILTVDTVNFNNNSAGDSGGAVFLDGITEIRASTFLENTAKKGGGIYNQGELTLLNSTVANNETTGASAFDGGGGILNTSGGRLVVDASLISNNISANSGGGILNLATDRLTDLAIANSAIVGNQAATLGGGIEIAGIVGLSNLSQLSISNSTLSGNQASVGGGIRTVGPTTLTNITVADNIATTSGGGISDNADTAVSPELINTIVANNIAPINPDVEGRFTDKGHNLIGTNQGSTGLTASSLIGTINNPLNPRLTPLNNDIGPLPSHQLLSDSPAINAGNNSAAAEQDQHGRPRIVDRNVDLGAVEFPTPLTSQSQPVQENPAPPRSEEPQLVPPAPPTTPTEVSTPATLAANINSSSPLNQEEKTAQPLGQEETDFSISNGRINYFNEEAFHHLEISLSKDYEDYWQTPQTGPVTLQTNQQTLHRAKTTYEINSAIVYAVFVPKTSLTGNSSDGFILPHAQRTQAADDQLLLVFVSDTGQPIQQLVNVSRAELTQQAKLFRLAVSDPEDPISYKALAEQMYGWLMAPLQKELAEQNIEHIMYALDQGLRTIPLAAMMQEDSFVIEQYGVSIIPSMGMTQYAFDSSSQKLRSLAGGANEFQGFENLPAVSIELDVVAENIETNSILLNDTFALNNFLAVQQVQQPNLLHLATHAEFNAGDLEQSFIQFWDSPLTFHQMKELNWPELELLILSACGTALSSPEAELGFIGLAAAAGIETSMGSLWNVSDIGTLALMAEFYTQLPKTSLRSQSLRKAQLSLIRGETHINTNALTTSQEPINLPRDWALPTSAEFSHPFYWAGFTIVGNPWH